MDRVTTYKCSTPPAFKFMNDISPEDIVILIVGSTGSGKSNFINVITDATNRTTSSLGLCPSEIATVRISGGNGLVLVDTPGIDGYHDDEDRVRLDGIWAWLEMINEAGIQLSGILYLFPISSNRILPGESAILHKTWGRGAAKNLILVTTMWDVVDFDRARSRESDIKSHFSRLTAAGMTIERFGNSRTAARSIVDRFAHGDMIDTKMVFTKRCFTRIDDKWEIIKDSTSRNAIHNFEGSTKWPANMRRTRAEIMDWVNGTAGAPIMWLYGAAGAGKSTVAHALAESCYSENLLLATFFFSGTDHTRNAIHPLVATITYQIRNAVSPARRLILEALEADTRVFAKSFENQFSSLIARPLAKLDGSVHFPRLIIIDGLDECADQVMQSRMIRGLVKSVRKKPNYPLRFLIVSRPEHHLDYTFSEVPSFVIRLELENLFTTWRKFGEASAPRAIHNSGERHDPPKCHPRTRIVIRNRLMDWITRKSAIDTRILWFYGPAATGKSAIAQTLAETCELQKLLLASFFFSRTDPTRNAVNSLAVTIAFQMGTVIPDMQEMILGAEKRHTGILTASFESQLTNLIIQPFVEFMNQDGISKSQLPHIVIVDGLDECFDTGTQSQIVVSLSGALRNVECPLRLVIVSRPEPHLEDVFSTKVLTSMVYRLELTDSCIGSNEDMRLFLQDELAKIKQNPKFHSLHSSWPGPPAIDCLVQRSCGQFVYASTVAKYIASSDDPCVCLETVIEIQCRQEDKGMPFAELDLLYWHIFSSVKDIQMTKMILGVILFIEPDYDFFAPLNSVQSSATQTLTGIENLLGLNSGEAVIHLKELDALIQYSDDGHVFLSHATVAEFLGNPARSKAFHLDKIDILTRLVGLCFQNTKNVTSSNSTSIRYAYGRIPQLCLRLPSTPFLRTELKEFSLSRCYDWCQQNATSISVGLKKAYLFPWWYVTRYLVILRQLEEAEVYLVQLSAFDKLVHLSLERYPSNKDLCFLLALTNIPMTSTNLTYKQVVRFLGRLQIQDSTLDFDWSRGGLGLLSTYSEGRNDEDCFRVTELPGLAITMHTYYQFLPDFFSNPKRSGAYFLSSKTFTYAALRCLKFVARPAQDLTDGDMDAIQIALFLIPDLLARASWSIELLILILSKGFKSNFPLNLNGQEGIDAVQISITEYKRKYKLYTILLGFLLMVVSAMSLILSFRLVIRLL